MSVECDVCGRPAVLEVRFVVGRRWWAYCVKHSTRRPRDRRGPGLPWPAWAIADLRRVDNPTGVG